MLISSASGFNSISNPIDLWIVGAGTLGSEVAHLWKQEFSDSLVVAETRFKLNLIQ